MSDATSPMINVPMAEWVGDKRAKIDADRSVSTWRSMCEALVEVHESGDQKKMADVVRVAKKLLAREDVAGIGTIKFMWKSP